jgi:hypothetical protein
MSATTRRQLPADVYDTLELAALANGGVGAGFAFHRHNPQMPCCIHGLAEFAGDGNRTLNYALSSVGIDGDTNDAGVEAINARKDPGGYTDTAVTFAEWCAELNVVRGTE